MFSLLDKARVRDSLELIHTLRVLTKSDFLTLFTHCTDGDPLKSSMKVLCGLDSVLCMICEVQILLVPIKLVLDRAGNASPTWQHERSHANLYYVDLKGLDHQFVIVHLSERTRSFASQNASHTYIQAAFYHAKAGHLILVRCVFTGGAADCDHWHDGAGFVTTHVGISLMFEQSLQAVNPSIALPYWDFTIEGTVMDWTNFRDGVVFSDDWFGNAAPRNVSSKRLLIHR